MTDPWSDRLSEYLDGDLPDEEQSACREHLHECADCARMLAGIRSVAAEARHAADLPPARDLWPKIEASIRDESPIAMPRSPVRTLRIVLLTAAATLAVCATIWALSRFSAGNRVRGERYLLLLHEPAAHAVALPPDERERAIARYRDWSRELAGAERLGAAEKLDDGGGFTLLADGSRAPRSNAGLEGEIGGFFVVTAANEAEAERIASTCPHLAFGGWIEVRHIEDT